MRLQKKINEFAEKFNFEGVSELLNLAKAPAKVQSLVLIGKEPCAT